MTTKTPRTTLNNSHIESIPYGRDAMMRVLCAIYETIVETGTDGAVPSALYLALAEKGCSVEQWNNIEAAMIDSGLVVKRNGLLFAAEVA